MVLAIALLWKENAISTAFALIEFSFAIQSKVLLKHLFSSFFLSLLRLPTLELQCHIQIMA